MSVKFCCVQYLLVFRLISGYMGEILIPGLRRRDCILRALFLVVTSFWPQKLGSRGETYSARWKLMLISHQVKDLVKNCFEGEGLHVSLSATGLHLGSYCLSREKFHVTIYVGKGRVLRSNLTVSPVWKYYEWFSEVL